ncbi:signal transduction response regulator [Gottschalkia acidurici 9a]|uniref:Signal transduction response regulator n=1 Tax=Gottschalkia acidurici (strain ATCC 7906 / DSM 604 / BCRC 14475 / CIP 104303 / KCTC 5404 / NCIMB 10678 / 9a) TaxID=1128398 RepID=K0AYW9_GOTA9|nr:response regulator [Gottschalkia acidurici]AFS77611.1 signal transduction response regulator [Gottschalkia acidurici 9a]
MNIFIVEDDNNIIRVLEKIIKDRELGTLLGYANDGVTGLEEIQAQKPDIVLVDLLMPGKDGISLVREVRSIHPNIQFIMISQVSSKDMIGKSYESGIEYFISKPINAIEIESVIRKVQDKIDMNRKLNQIQSLFIKDNNNSEIEKEFDRVENIKKIMQRIGIMGESGSQDIINITKYLIDTKQSTFGYTAKELCSKFTDQPKTMEQRIRRTATVGMINLANIGIEDYMNEIYNEYSNGLYNFEQIKIEMDYIRGKSNKRGTVNVKKFIDGMVFYSNRNE